MMNTYPLPTSPESLVQDWQTHFYPALGQYERGEKSFIANFLPEFAVKLEIFQTLDILQKRLGTAALLRALNPDQTVDSPGLAYADSTWLKTSKMVGINVRTIGNFWNVVNYAFTLPQAHDSVHLLPIWEPGVVGSLYGKVSWNINTAFFNSELHRAVPHLDTVEKQLKVVVNLLHALGKTVGLDVIPHNDRFSEIVLTYPRLFEWVRRNGPHITDHTEKVWVQVEEQIWQFLQQRGPADGSQLVFGKKVLFDPANRLLTDAQRQQIIFGFGQEQRLQRRLELIQMLINQGFETLPMTMAPPYRGLHINPDAFVLDVRGTRWYQYDFDRPKAMSRVFGPLTRYRFFHSKNDNQAWELDFENPNRVAWDYICRKYYECQQQFNFDFMRGDMAHVQMQPDGVPTHISDFYDPLRAVKKYIQRRGVKHFAFYAETFLAPPDTMGYGDELAHLEAIEADATLGDLQASPVGSANFMRQFTDYDRYLRTRQFAPSFTVITADKDDPRFDGFYQKGNIVRYFVALFLTDMPSYYSLGFEARQPNETRAKNETYSKLYVFQINNDNEPDKVTHGPFEWGRNCAQFGQIMAMRLFAEKIWNEIKAKPATWLLAPAATAERKLIAWQVKNYLFVANLDTNNAASFQSLNLENWNLVFAISNQVSDNEIDKGGVLVYQSKM